MAEGAHALAPEHLPGFITAPGASDWLFNVVAVSLAIVILIAGALYLTLHSLPERMAHGARKTQFELVAVLGLIALFTHENLFWVAALILALIDFPDFRTPLVAIADAATAIAKRDAAALDAAPDAAADPAAEPAALAAPGDGREHGRGEG